VVKGLSIEGGLTDHTMPEASVKRKMIAGAEKIVVMADHTKLGRTALSKVADLDVMDVLITSVDLNKEIFSKLEELGVEVHLCTLSESKDK
jgi:DeoR family fructose operon transcriptional repressor